MYQGLYQSPGIALKLVVAACFSIATAASAGPVLIINGLSTTSEVGTTTSITTSLVAKHTAAGNTTTVVDQPLSLAQLTGFTQVWDIRFSNSTPITAGQQADYLAYLQQGGGMFVMGENSGFATRNNSVLAFINLAGGGSLIFTTPNSTQTVFAPFTGPFAIPDANVTYAAPGGVTTAGTGQFMTGTSASGPGTGIAFDTDDLANALTGALTVVFDVNFMQDNAETDSQNFLRNIIGFVQQQVEPPAAAPEPTALWLTVLGLLGLAAARRRKASV